MKFTIIALAGALASANAHQLRTNARKLDGGNNNGYNQNNYRAELDGSATITFAKCIEVTVQPDGDEDTQYAIQAGTAKPVLSYAAFYPNNYLNDKDMMMVPLGEYVAGKVNSIAMKTQKMCESCREFEETCNPQQNVSENFYLYLITTVHPVSNDSAEICIFSTNTDKTGKTTPTKTKTRITKTRTTPTKTMPTKTMPTMRMARMLMVLSASSPPLLSTLTSVTPVRQTAATSRSRITARLTTKSK